MKENKNKISIKRVTSAVILFPIIAVFVMFGNDLVINILAATISMICIYEYTHAFKMAGKANPSSWVAYIISALLLFQHSISEDLRFKCLLAIIPIALYILVTEMVISNGKKTIKDVIVTMFSIMYIPFMLFFLSEIRNIKLESAMPNLGKALIWYVFIASWISDIFAYAIGKRFGKHKYTKISPNKSVEGAVAGVVSAIICGIIYTVILNSVYSLGINIGIVVLAMLVLSIFGQCGDLLASSIKRYVGIKDFSELIPGHGGLLDRLDSVIYILPMAYCVCQYIVFSIK